MENTSAVVLIDKTLIISPHVAGSSLDPTVLNQIPVYLKSYICDDVFQPAAKWLCNHLPPQREQVVYLCLIMYF